MASDAADLIFETPDIDEFADRLKRECRDLFGETCALTEPEAADWTQQPSNDAAWFIARRLPREPNQPVCVVPPVVDRSGIWQRLFGANKGTGRETQGAIEEALRRLRATQEQEVARRKRENLPTLTPGDTWIRVGFRMHRSPESPRTVISVREVYIGK
jgi:hypothetical protein